MKKKKKMQIFINKHVYLGLTILEISKIIMYEFFMIVWNQGNRKK